MVDSVSEPEWTRVRQSLDRKSVIDYVITMNFPP